MIYLMYPIHPDANENLIHFICVFNTAKPLKVSGLFSFIATEHQKCVFESKSGERIDWKIVSIALRMVSSAVHVCTSDLRGNLSGFNGGFNMAFKTA